MNITDPIFQNETLAREHLEAVRWPNGPYCAHCGSFNVMRLEGDGHRVGLLQCRDCRKQFSVTVGTVFERSHLPLHKWLLASHLMAASKKGISAHQLHRMLGISYKSAWFMCHRIREAMTDPNAGPLGGEGKIVEADETYHGKAENAAAVVKRYTKGGKSGPGGKRPIVALVERDGAARAFHMPKVTAKNVGEVLAKHADAKSRLHTDESRLYPPSAEMFAQHETVRHSAKEYARGDVNTNSVEGFFGLFKRGMTGAFHHCGEQHLQRYLDEFSFRWSHRKTPDSARAARILKGAEGKRLTYRRINGAAHA